MTTSFSGSKEHLFQALPELAAEARTRAVEFEDNRQISVDFVAKLKRAGVYRILVAREQGGLGGSLLDWLKMVLSLSEADASTGWTCAHGAVCSALIANLADPEFVESFFADPQASAAWSNLPQVQVSEEDDGLRISGRWSFETGCTAATYVGGMVERSREDPSAPPRYFACLAPIAQAQIEKTWDPIGLAGTGSHDVIFDDLLVPWNRIFEWPDGKPRNAYPWAVFTPGTWFISICAAATHLGLARRALDEARASLTGKMDRFSGQPVLAKPGNLRALEEAEGLLFACRSGLENVMREIWERAQSSQPLGQDLRIMVRLATTTAVHQCEGIVRAAYDVAGASAVRRTGVLQRLYRDASCLTHHVSVNGDSFERVGRVRGGFDPLDFRI